MGTDCAPLLANLLLFYYEYEYMKNLLSVRFEFDGSKKIAITTANFGG